MLLNFEPPESLKSHDLKLTILNIRFQRCTVIRYSLNLVDTKSTIFGENGRAKWRFKCRI